MQRRAFVHALGASLATGPWASRVMGSPRRLNRIGLELYSVRDAMGRDPDGTLAAVRAMGYTDVELLWSFGNFGRTTEQVRAALDHEGLRAPSAHISPISLFVGWNRSLEIAHRLGHEYLIVPSFTGETSGTLDDWREWADRFNTAGAAARRAGIWLAFHNEADHMPLIDGKVPYDVFVERTDPKVVRLQLDVGNMVIGAAIRSPIYSATASGIGAFILKTSSRTARTTPCWARGRWTSSACWLPFRTSTTSSATWSRKAWKMRSAARGRTASFSRRWSSRLPGLPPTEVHWLAARTAGEAKLMRRAAAMCSSRIRASASSYPQRAQGRAPVKSGRAMPEQAAPRALDRTSLVPAPSACTAPT